MGIIHQQRYQRDRTIDAQPNEPIEVAFADALARHEVRIARLEALVTQLSREALRNAVTDAVTHNATRDAPVTATVTLYDEKRNARNANAERQRRYRERKKHGVEPAQR